MSLEIHHVNFRICIRTTVLVGQYIIYLQLYLSALKCGFIVIERATVCICNVLENIGPSTSTLKAFEWRSGRRWRKPIINRNFKN